MIEHTVEGSIWLYQLILYILWTRVYNYRLPRVYINYLGRQALSRIPSDPGVKINPFSVDFITLSGI